MVFIALDSQNKPSSVSPTNFRSQGPTHLILSLITSSFVFLADFSTKAQSLIVGIPSADVTHPGLLEWTHESQFAPKSNNTVAWNSFNFLTYGIAKNTEISISLNNLGYPSTFNEALGFGAKRIIPLYHGEADHDNKNHHLIGHDTRLTVGAVANYSFSRKQPGYWVFSHLSYRLPAIYTRLTAGVSNGNAPTFGYRNIPTGEGLSIEQANQPWSAIVGFEQPIAHRWSFIADWFSGTHDLACFIPAIQYEREKQVIIVGYKIPNNGLSGYHALVLETMVRF